MTDEAYIRSRPLLRSRWGQVIGDEDCPFLRRWTLETRRGRSIRLHHFFPDHLEDVAHDHPWWFITFVFKGGYIDYTCAEGETVKTDYVDAIGFRYRSGDHQHMTRTDRRGAWTIVITGKLGKRWGFWVDKRFIPHFNYFGKRAPCND